ncbi:MAG: hypothetical protein ABSF49_12910 [Roseiarcus sp.]|uniref:hypothetical protein n=1 Tax=Roseiarcus sp. TaxID=1969460 RepID=UPI003C1908DD
MARTAILAAGFALATILGGVGAASADVYAFSFVADTSDTTDADYGSLVITGDLFTAGPALPAGLTGIIGLVTSEGTSGIDSGTITGLSSYADADNILYETGAPGQVSFSGISFVEGGETFNLYSWNEGDYALVSVVDAVGYPQNGVVGTLTVTAVPELSTWAMLLAGFAGLGFAGWRRGRVAEQAA